MWIICQSKNSGINTDNVINIYTNYDTKEMAGRIVAHTINEKDLILGVYNSKELMDSIVQEIYKNIYKKKVYQMPKLY